MASDGQPGCQEAGFDAHLAKPAKPAEIERLLGR
jgi:hypothetical protein